jgi:acetyl-CoA C-acetyltransferase
VNRTTYIIDGGRTPFLKARNKPGPFAASDLATAAGRAVLNRQAFEPSALDEVILGCAAPSVDEVNIGRVTALRMGCGQKVPGWTVMRTCAPACSRSIRRSRTSDAGAVEPRSQAASTRCRMHRSSTPKR